MKPTKRRRAREFRLLVSSKRGEAVFNIDEKIQGHWYSLAPLSDFSPRKIRELIVREVLKPKGKK